MSVVLIVLSLTKVAAITLVLLKIYTDGSREVLK